MKRRTAIVAGLFLASQWLIGPAQASDCWVEIFDKTLFEGAHARLEGPADLPDLKRIGGADWSARIESLKVGPKAKVVAFRNENFKENAGGPVYHGEALQAWGESPESYSDQEIAFGPGAEEHHLGELNFHRAIRSLAIKCLP